MEMKKFGLIFFHLVLIGVTNGGWLLFLVPYIIYKKIKQSSSKVLSNETSESPQLEKKFSGNKFAQDSAKGAVFTYASSEKGDIYNAPYAIIDLETTGLDKTRNRIIEVAIRRIDANGKFIDEISTLINPEVSDVGPTFIHHIKLVRQARKAALPETLLTIPLMYQAECGRDDNRIQTQAIECVAVIRDSFDFGIQRLEMGEAL
ncbi:MAG: hypothetical protein RJB29_345, partial [Actinomycetota bacterium]